MGDQIFLLIFVELFCGEPTEEVRGPSELRGARRLHMSFRMRETGPKFNGEKLAARGTRNRAPRLGEMAIAHDRLIPPYWCAGRPLVVIGASGTLQEWCLAVL